MIGPRTLARGRQRQLSVGGALPILAGSACAEAQGHRSRDLPHANGMALV